MTIANTLPEDFLARALTMDDLETVSELIIACEEAERTDFQ